MDAGARVSGGSGERGESRAGGAAGGPLVARVVSVNVSAERGVRKAPQPEIVLAPDHGVVGDGHAGTWHRQVSLLALESIDSMRRLGLDVNPGDFGENVTTEGIAVAELPLGTRLELGGAVVEVTQIGKVCHERCAIFYQAGDCVMPREGIFVRVLEGGGVRSGDPVRVRAADVAGDAAPATERRGEGR